MDLKASLRHHEGWRDKAYYDSEGILTIGYGRNLETLRIDKETGERWLVEDLGTATREALRFPEMGPEYMCRDTMMPRRDVFVEMVFNMGAPRVAGFRNMLAAIRVQDWRQVRFEMCDSRWHGQVGIRARRLAAVMLENSWDAVFLDHLVHDPDMVKLARR